MGHSPRALEALQGGTWVAEQLRVAMAWLRTGHMGACVCVPVGGWAYDGGMA